MATKPHAAAVAGVTAISSSGQPLVTHADHAYDMVRRAILRLDHRPGDVLKESELMKQLGVGRTPLREALQRLASDGLVTVMPHRGTVVSNVSPSDVEALFELRRELDAFVARLAAERATDQDKAALRALIETPGGLDADPEAYDRQFHSLIAAAGHNPYVEGAWRRVYEQSVWMLNILRTPREGIEEMRTELRDVVNAIEARDAEAAGAAASRHVLSRGWF
jgi:DNA-binding GntR family transcriptional regulator